ncbi:protein kinase [Aspergillus aculeatinus CBS 121060]|uniref:Protein kinase n=1 Tax=Aspergillus aculeatinus CBS 121060 TaxID=1448322 RepID=A0ACD1HLL1_9EURO|nr:protein kinase [Aspergillus aculeatinus CBS 121060]RAH74708.1 protein kinase [Aspergillus aculeatinus CBS 121060]
MGKNDLIEEQTLLYYHQKRYYPVRIGDTFKDQYRIIAKPGYGAYSTVWLAWDERNKQYTSLKVCIGIEQADKKPSPVLNEVRMLERVQNVAEAADHPGLYFIRLATNIFELHSSSGRHYCIAAKPQSHSLRTLQTTYPNARVPRLLVRSLVHRLFFSINWLHATCGLIHTDISPLNVLMKIEDDASLKDIEQREARDPSIPITCEFSGAPVYRSREPLLEVGGAPILTDFGHLREFDFDGLVNNDWVMPDLYRAPEVLLQIPWTLQVDMWSVDVMTLELLEGKNLFDPIDRVNHQYVLPLALAQYIGYLGLPPLHMLQESPLFSTHFDEKGNWMLAEAPIPQTSLEEFVTCIPPGEEKDQFLRFIRKMLAWDPEARATANEMIDDDEWLQRPFHDMLESTCWFHKQFVPRFSGETTSHETQGGGEDKD